MAFIAPEGYRWGEEPEHPHYTKSLCRCLMRARQLCEEKGFRFVQTSHVLYAVLELNSERILSLYMSVFVYIKLCKGVRLLVENESIPKSDPGEKALFLQPIHAILAELVKSSAEANRKIGILDLLELLADNISDPAIQLCIQCGVNKFTIRQAKQVLSEW